MASLSIPTYRNPISGKLQGKYNPDDFLLVTGTGFGTKPYSSPITWETFNGTDGQLVSAYNPSWVGYNGNAGGLISSLNPRFSGHKSAYNVATRDQFDTNYKTNIPRKSRTRYLSYYVRVNYREDVEAGQIKLARVTTSAASGGGGVYNGVGSQIVNAPAPKGWQPTWTGSNTSTPANMAYLNGDWYPANRWIRMEYEVYLSDLDVANGFFNIHCAHQGSGLSGNVMQRYTGYGANDYLLDTALLGIETVNTEKWLTPNVLTANTTYTVTATHPNTTVYNSSWTSGGSAPTAAQVVDGLKASFVAVGMPPTDIKSNVGNLDEFAVWWAYSVTYSANLSRNNPISVQQSETYEDDDFKRFYLANADTWASCTESNPQPYSEWSDSAVLLVKYVGGINGRTWLYKQLTPNTTPTLVGEVVGNSVIYD